MPVPDRPMAMLVDDEIANIEIINAVLEDDDDACFALSGEEALDLARTAEPDLILRGRGRSCEAQAPA